MTLTGRIVDEYEEPALSISSIGGGGMTGGASEELCKRAESDLTRCIELKPDYRDAYYYRAIIFSLSTWDRRPSAREDGLVDITARTRDPKKAEADARKYLELGGVRNRQIDAILGK